MSAYSIIDVDTHVTETPDVWVDRVPARMRDKVPYVDVDKRGRQCWFLNGKRMSIIGLTATAGRGDMQNWPATYDDMHPGAYDANERLKYMDEMGIWAMVMYPNVAGFGNQQFLQLGDPELMLACVEAYNDWQTDWASADSRRLLPITSIPFWDIDAAVKEVRRCADKGHRGILFTGEPQAFGQPFMGDRHWDPLWETAVELNLPLSFHIGSGDMEDGLGREKVAAYGRMSTFTSGSVNVFLKNGFQMSELLLSGIFVRHPEVQFVSVESGVGWIPFTLEALDYQFHGQPGLRRAPRVRPAAVGVLQDQRPRLLLVRAGRAGPPHRQGRRRPHHVRDRLPAPHLALRGRRPHRDRQRPRRFRRGDPPQDPVGNGQKLYKVTEPTPADEEKLAALSS